MAARPLTALESALRKLIDDVGTAGLDYALVGGLAVSVWAEPRLTRDVDLAISVGSHSEAEAAVQGLLALGYTPVLVVEHDLTGRLSNVRLAHKDLGDVVVDLLFASSGIEPEVVASAKSVEILPGLVVPIASVGHLIVMKLLARDDRRRPADYDDLLALVAAASEVDLSEAKRAGELVATRGFNRGRDLVSGLSELTRLPDR